MRMMTAAKRLGLYSALRACSVMVRKQSWQPMFTVDTMFLNRSARLSKRASSRTRARGERRYTIIIHHVSKYIYVVCSLQQSKKTRAQANQRMDAHRQNEHRPQRVTRSRGCSAMVGRGDSLQNGPDPLGWRRACEGRGDLTRSLRCGAREYAGASIDDGDERRAAG